jgi:Uma2 family endonuclease
MPVATQPATYADGTAHHRFTVAEYNQMLAEGILDLQEQIELLEGWVVMEPPADPAHDRAIELVRGRLAAGVPVGWCCRTRLAVSPTTSQPDPDVSVVRGTPRDYLRRHPSPSEVGLVVEAANTSLQRDTLDKTRVYAADAIPEYWVVDVTNRRVEVYSSPAGGAYTAHRTLHPGDTLPLTLDGAAVAALPVADLVP